jgi:hypothetical protein
MDAAAVSWQSWFSIIGCVIIVWALWPDHSSGKSS